MPYYNDYNEYELEKLLGIGCGAIAVVLIISIVISLLLGFWAGKIADRKGRSFGGFFALGFFLGVLGVIIAACLKDENYQVPPTYQEKYGTNPYNYSHYTKTVSNGGCDIWTCNKCRGTNDGGDFCSHCGAKRGARL